MITRFMSIIKNIIFNKINSMNSDLIKQNQINVLLLCYSDVYNGTE